MLSHATKMIEIQKGAPDQNQIKEPKIIFIVCKKKKNSNKKSANAFLALLPFIRT